MTPAESIVEFAKTNLGDILTRSGRVLYSSAETLRPGRVYLLGHNPGESPRVQYVETVGQCLDRLPSKTDNSYLDEAWPKSSSKIPGEGKLQLRVKWLLESLGLNPRQVAASNLVFSRSIDAETSDFEQHAPRCWSVHERIIDIIQPRALIVFGNSGSSPYTFLRDKLGARREESIDSGHGSWSCKRFRSERYWVVGLPHLSRYKITGKAEVVNWIKECLVETA